MFARCHRRVSLGQWTLTVLRIAAQHDARDADEQSWRRSRVRPRQSACASEWSTSGAKHAIQGFHEALRCELLHDKSNVHVTMVQLPAVNTPQFSWFCPGCPSTPGRCPRFIGPSSGPAASCMPPTTLTVASTGWEHPRWPPCRQTRSSLGCWIDTLGRTGVKSQQTKHWQEPGAPVNLWEPADGPDGQDFGAHGVFDTTAHARDPQLWASHHHSLLGAAIGGISATAGAVLRARRR